MPEVSIPVPNAGPDIGPNAGPAELEHLIGRGVHLPAPHLVSIAKDVPLEAIAPGVVLHPYTRLSGPRTRLDAGAVIGPAGAATIQNSWIGSSTVVGSLGPVTLIDSVAGAGTVLGSGVAEGAVFLGRKDGDSDFTTGYGFRVRKGTLYEEGANSAQHTDTKMTIAFPWVTLGSNINWCDILIAGGSGPQPGSFSEIGSGAIHFNFTPRGDKATGTMLGNVCDGIFLDRARVFIGGNAGLIGPLHGDFGAVSPAGAIIRRDLSAGLYPMPQSTASQPATSQPADPARSGRDFDADVYGSIHRVYVSQIGMIGQLAALDAWYAFIRPLLAEGSPDRIALYARGRDMVRANLRERITQLTALAVRVEHSIRRLEQQDGSDPRLQQHRAFLSQWPSLEIRLNGFEQTLTEPPEALTEEVVRQAENHQGSYTDAIQALAPQAVEAGRRWLRDTASVVASADVLDVVPPLPR